MALREFLDRAGRRWRAWDIRPEQMHAATRAEDYLKDVMHGWLAFEPAAGGEKRRLSPIPANWEKATEAELQAMLERAESARTDSGVVPRYEPRAEPTVPADTAPTGIRTFRYPGGRYWTVNEQSSSTTGEHPGTTLRFTSGARSLETQRGPQDWSRLSEAALAELLYHSFPREPASDNPTPFRRRRGDDA
jgi:hypothetical protein